MVGVLYIVELHNEFYYSKSDMRMVVVLSPEVLWVWPIPYRSRVHPGIQRVFSCGLWLKKRSLQAYMVAFLF